MQFVRTAFPLEDTQANLAHCPHQLEEALSSLNLLVDLLSDPFAASSLLPLQLEVLFCQLTHMLFVARVWDDSGSMEEMLRAVLACAQALVRMPFVATDIGRLLSANLRGSTGQMLSELLRIATAHPSAALRTSCIGAVSRVCCPPASMAGLDQDVLGFFLPGAVSKLMQLCSDMWNRFFLCGYSTDH